MVYAKALKRAVVKALKGRTKQEFACKDVEAQAESDKMEVLVTVEGKWRGFRPSESPLQAGCDMDEACSVRRTGGKELRARGKIPVWEKMEGVCVKTGHEKNRYEVNGQIHGGDLIC